MKKLTAFTLSLLFAFSVFAQHPISTKYVNGFPSTSYAINLASDVQYYAMYGTKTLSSGYTITTTGTPVNGSCIVLSYDGSGITAAGNTVTVFGVVLSATQAVQKWLFIAVYKGSTSTWDVRYFRDGSITSWLGKTDLNSSMVDDTTIQIPANGALRVKPLGLTNAHIGTSAAIAYSKLALTGSILNADVNTSAGIAWSKLAAGTASRAMVSDGSGYPTTSAVTATELGYVSGVTSAIQTQLNTKTTSGNIVNADISGSAAIAYSKLNLTGSIVNADVASGAAIAASKLSLGCTPTELTYLSGVTSAIQTQINNINTGKITYADLTTNTTLTSSTIKSSMTLNSTGGGFNVTLPVASTVTAGTYVEFFLHGTNTSKILTQGTDKIINKYAASVTSDTLTPTYRGVMMYSDGSANWIVGRRY